MKCPNCGHTFTSPASRRSDPETSHLAEQHIKETGKLERWKHQVKMYVDAFPGRTARELARDSRIPYETIHKRLPELEKDGDVQRAKRKKCDITGRLCNTWVVEYSKDLFGKVLTS